MKNCLKSSKVQEDHGVSFEVNVSVDIVIFSSDGRRRVVSAT